MKLKKLKFKKVKYTYILSMGYKYAWTSNDAECVADGNVGYNSLNESCWE